jgi:thermitase
MVRASRAPALAGAFLIVLIVSSLSIATSVSSAESFPSAARKNALSPTRGKATLRALARERRLWVPGELVVGFKENVSSRARSAVLTAEDVHVEEHFPELDASLVDLPAGTSVPEALEDFGAREDIAFAEPNKLIFGALTPDDPRFGDLWGMENTGQEHRVSDPPPSTASGKPDADGDVDEAWDTHTGDPATVIAILDSGVDTEHPDLDDNLWINPDEIPANNIDDDGNGFKDDVHGWDFAENNAGLLETNNDVGGIDHGTHVAGTAAAEINNTTGVAGVCPSCSIMVLKFMKPGDTDGDHQPDEMIGTLAAELKALDYAIDEGAHIVNGSFTTFLWSRSERAAYNELGNAGILAVAAAGNSSLDNDMLLNYEFPDGSLAFSPEYPASFDLPKILAVAATNHKDQYGYFTGCDIDFARWICEFTSWGHDSVDVAAPGVDIVSTVPDNKYRTFTGTSMAAPFTAGIAGLVRSANPTYGAMAMKNAIMNSVNKPDSLREMPAFSGGPATGRFTLTSGRVNAERALTASTDEATPKSDGNIVGAKSMDRFRAGKVSWPEDTNDVYQRWFKKDKKYKIVLNGPDRQDFDLIAWKPKTKEIWQLEDGCFLGGPGGCKMLRYVQNTDKTKADEQFKFTAKKTGMYYLHVSAFLHNTGKYMLKAKQI